MADRDLSPRFAGGLPPERASVKARRTMSPEDLELVDTGADGAAGGQRLRNFAALLWRRKAIIGVGVALGLLLALTAVMLAPVRYVATSSVQIDQQAARVVDTDDAAEQSGGYMDVDRFLRTQVDVLNSRAMALRVAQAEKLAEDDRFLVRMGVKLPTAKTDAATATRRREDMVVSTLRANLSTTLPRDSRIVTISFRSPDAALAAQVANAFADQFVTNNLSRRLASTGYARDYLGKQLAQARGRLEGSERQLNAYARRANLIDTSLPSTNGQGSTARSPTTANLVNVNDSYAAATAARVQAQERWESARAIPLESIPDVLSNPAIQELLQDRARKQAALADERKRRRDDFPTVIQAKAELDEINRQITTIATRIRDSLQAQYRAAAAQESALLGDVNRLKSETLAEQDRSVEYNVLRRDVDTNRSLYDALLQRFRSVSAVAGVTSNNLSVVDVAETPGAPALPNLKLILLAGAVLGGAAALGLALLLDQLNTRLRTPEEVESVLDLPVLGVVPRQRNHQQFLDGALKDGTASAEAYASLLIGLTFATPDGLPRSLVVTSSQSGEGKTVSSLVIAHAVARRGNRVLLIDADLRRPAVARYLGRRNGQGLGDVLTGAARLDEVVAETDEQGLFVLSAGTMVTNPADLLQSAALLRTIHDAQDRFDYVVIDSSPVLGLADALALASVADATIMMLDTSRTSRAQVRNALKRLATVNANLLGIVISKAPRELIQATYGADYLAYSSQAAD